MKRKGDFVTLVDESIVLRHVSEESRHLRITKRFSRSHFLSRDRPFTKEYNQMAKCRASSIIMGCLILP